MANEKKLTEAEQKAWEAEMKAAGIKVVTDAPSTITLVNKRVSTEQMIAEAKATGVEVTVTAKSTGGEIVPLPGIRAPR